MALITWLGKTDCVNEGKIYYWKHMYNDNISAFKILLFHSDYADIVNVFFVIIPFKILGLVRQKNKNKIIIIII